MLTRKAIDSGSYLGHFESQPNLWSLERIERSLADTLNSQPAATQDVWIFGYGSLMWNPMVEFEAKQTALLPDWHRAFCLRMVVGRGSPELPGRMLAVEPRGATQGVALKLPRATMNRELQLLWVREMVLGSYRPIWAPIMLGNGTKAQAIVFVANEDNKQYEADSSVETVAPLIDAAQGEFGSNVDYVRNLHASLDEFGLHDPYIDALIERIAGPDKHSLCGAAD